MATASTPLRIPDLGDAYAALYDILSKMYWEASSIETKDLVHGVMEEVGEIIDELDSADLEQNTAAFVALRGRIGDANKALQKIQHDVAQITKNISTASAAVAAIAKVLALVPKLAA